MMPRRLILMPVAAALVALADGCAGPASTAAKPGDTSRTIEARVYPLRTGAVIYLPDSTLAVNRETSEVLLQSGYVRLESKGRENPGAIKLKTYGTLLETRGAGEVIATPGRHVRASCLRGTVKLKFPGGAQKTRTLNPGQVATIQLKRSNTKVTGS
jgi:ferric-dicitrate binding protein FerR (iron transport regulator)